MAATLSFGLSEDSRIKRKLAGSKATTQTLLLATIADRLGLLLWAQTEDGHKGKHKPPMLTEKLLGREEEESLNSFSDVESFEEARRRILGG